MGRDIPWTEFTDEDYDLFQSRLRDETRTLMNWFQETAFEAGPLRCGFELEAWLTDSKHLPSATNESLIEQIQNPLVVPELAKFNFEINSTPQHVTGTMLSAMERELRHVWGLCQTHAEAQGDNIVAIGILPTVTDAMLNLDNMSSLRRYFALNQQVMSMRRGQPIHLRIDGEDSLHVSHTDVMLESVATSLQIHLQVDPQLAPRYYNAAQVLSAPIVAAAANSPYLFGHDLWDETRIPVFEQAVSVASFQAAHGDMIGRVTFGTGFCRDSIFEPFLENLDGFPILLPLVFDEDPSWLSHLRLHNGTIWRWNRPLIGLGPDGKPHIRIEHRTPAAGPSVPDVIANIALFTGLMLHYGTADPPLESKLTFEETRTNFYNAARYGLRASIKWIDGKDWEIARLLTEVLVPAATEGLMTAGLDTEEVYHYMNKIIHPRITSRQNGTGWQRAFIEKYGKDFVGLTRTYAAMQKEHLPVHKWEV